MALNLEDANLKSIQEFEAAKTARVKNAQTYVEVEAKISEAKTTLAEAVLLKKTATPEDKRKLEKIEWRLVATLNMLRKSSEQWFPATDELKLKLDELEDARKKFNSGKGFFKK